MKKRNWFWNILIVLTLVVCVFAFVLHYKNWSKFEAGNFQVISGVYKQQLSIVDINNIEFVDKLPQMERKNGFSWLAREKGVFKDSLTASDAYVFVDDLQLPKIRIVHHDSLKLYINYTDSLETITMYTKIKKALEDVNE